MTACFEYPFRPPQIAEARGEDPSSHAVELEEENMRAAEDAWCSRSGSPSFAGRLNGTAVAIGTNSFYFPITTPVTGTTTWVDGVTHSAAGFIIPQSGVWLVACKVGGSVTVTGLTNVALNLQLSETTTDESDNVPLAAAGTYGYVLRGSRLVRFTAGDVVNAWVECALATAISGEGNISGHLVSTF